MPDCYLALGANLGPVAENFDQAIHSLAAFKDLQLVSVSSTYRTAPVGRLAGAEFLNAACRLQTEIAPLELLDRMQSIETQLGRVRDVHWGPRTLDLDLIFYGDRTIRLPQLCVPHPAAWYRRFVLDPLEEIAANVVHPEKRLTVTQLRQRLLARPLPFALAGGSLEQRDQLFSEFRTMFPGSVEFTLWQPSGETPPREPVIIAWLGPDVADNAAPKRFEDLPVASRLDAAALGTQTAEFLTDVLHAALGE